MKGAIFLPQNTSREMGPDRLIDEKYMLRRRKKVMKNRLMVSVMSIVLMMCASLAMSCSKGEVPKKASMPDDQIEQEMSPTMHIAARVNGREISMEALQNEMHRGALKTLSGRKPTREEAAQIRKDALDFLIMMDLAAEYGMRHFKPSEEEVDERVKQVKDGLKSDEAFAEFLRDAGQTEETFRDEIRIRLAVERAFEQKVHSQVVFDNEEARRQYEERIEEFTLPERIAGDVIQVYAGHGREDARRRAEEMAAVVKGAKDTSALKDERDIFIIATTVSNSENPDLFGRVSGLEPMEVSDIFEKNGYFQFMFVRKRVPGETVPFERAVELLRQDALAERAREWYEELKKDADIEILIDGS